MTHNLQIHKPEEIVSNNELKDIGFTKNITSCLISPSGDVIVFGQNYKGESLIIVPKTDELDVFNHGLKGIQI